MADQDLMQSQDPMAPQFPGGGPPPFMQGGISPMMTGAPPAAGGVIPPSNPVDASQGAQPGQDPMQAAMLQSMQVGTQGMQNREQAAMGPQMGGQLPQLIQQHEQLAGQTSWHPNMQHGQGAGGFFHNLGQALIALGLATKPGAAVENVIYSKPRQEYAAQAEQIKSLQEQQKLTQEPEAALASLGPKYMTAQARSDMVDVARQRAQDYHQHIADQAKNWAANVDLRTAGQSEKGRHDLATELQAQANQMAENYRSLHRDATSVEVAGILTNAKEQLANEAALRDPSITGWLKNMIGIEAPQIQGAQSPTMGGPAAKTGAPSSPEASKAAAPAKAKTKGSSVASGGQHKVGDTVIVQGKQVRIGKIYPDGTFDPQ